MRLLLVAIALALSLASLPACTDPPATAEATAAISWECVPVCLPNRPCQNICALQRDEPGFAVVPGPSSCDKLRPINQCGDGCCDDGETDRLDREHWCPKDCRIARLEIAKLEDRLQILQDTRVLGLVAEDHLEASCSK